MKKLVLGIILFSLATGFSQESWDETTYSEVLTTQIETLELDGEKRDMFVEISDKYFEKMKAIKASEGSKMSKFKEFKSLQDEKNNEMKELLNDEEYKTFKEIQKENRSMLKDRYRQGNKS